MTETIKIGDKAVEFKATGSTLMRYREKFNRDLFDDFNKLTGEEVNGESMEILQRFAFIMAKQADDSVPDNVMDWLDSFEVFPFNEIAPKVVALWQKTNITTVKSKKAASHRSAQ